MNAVPFDFLTEYSVFYILPCLALGILYAWVLYSQKASWGTNLNRFLGAWRWAWVSIVALLLIGILVKQTQNFTEKPVVVFAIDNSESIKISTDTNTIRQTLQNIQKTALSLQEKGYEVAFRTINNSAITTPLENIAFTIPTSNITQLLKDIQTSYENRNLAEVILVSDGIYNQGISPDYMRYTFKLSTIGIGDTTAKTDLSIKNVFSNKIAYLGNKFPIVAEVYNSGFVGKTFTISLQSQGKIIETQTITPTKDNALTEVSFLVAASQKGIQHYSLSIEYQKGEFTAANNLRHVYVEVIDNREKILIAAAAPHPDVKALKAALENNENYQIDWYIPSINELNHQEKYDLVIFHQIPNLADKDMGWANELMRKAGSVCFVLGSRSNLQVFNQLGTGVRIQGSGGLSDKVTGAYNTNFTKFTFSADKRSKIMNFPPTTAVFGEYEMSAKTETLLWQRIGNLTTQRPLMAISENNAGQKVGLLFAEGIWQWRLQDYAKNQSFETFDELLNKFVQYISAKEDKRKFRIYTSSAEYFSTDPVLFEVETYNDIYEKTAGHKIELHITNEKKERKSYSFVNSSTSFRYTVQGLPEGIYTFKATTSLSGKAEEATGQFTIKNLQLEALHTQADFGMLKILASQNRGDFYTAQNIETFSKRITQEEPISIIHPSEETAEILNWKWLFVVLVLLASIEWFVRKYKGSY